MKKLIVLGALLTPGGLQAAGAATLTLVAPATAIPQGAIGVSTVTLNVGPGSVLGAVDFTVSFDSNVAQLSDVRALSPEFQNSVFFSSSPLSLGKVRIIILNAISTQTPSGLVPAVGLDFLAVGPDPSSATIHADITTLADAFGFYYAPTGAVDGLYRVSTDILSPRTNLLIGPPSYPSPTGGAGTFISSRTLLSLTTTDDRLADDDGLGVGVWQTKYAVDSATFSVYVGPFTIAAEGPRTLHWFSQDRALNAEVVRSTPMTVDNSPPLTQVAYAPPAYTDGSGNVYLSTNTIVSVSAKDAASGVAFTQYRLESSTLPFQTVSSTFTATVPAGVQAIEVRSQDPVGNLEPVRIFTVRVDSAPPLSQISVGAPQVVVGSGPVIIRSQTPIVIVSTDPTVGVVSSGWKDALVAVDLTSFSPLTPTLSLVGERVVQANPSPLVGEGLGEGLHTIQWMTRDHAGNTEAPQSLSVIVDTTPPTMNLVFSPDALILPSGDVFITTGTRIILGAQDGVAGLASIEYRVDASSAAGPFQTYSSSFSLAPGTHALDVRGRDAVGNARVTTLQRLVVEASLPDTTSIPGSYGQTLPDGTSIISTDPPAASSGPVISPEAPAVSAITLTPSSPVGAGPLTVVARFSKTMDASQAPTVYFLPSTSLTPVPVTQTTYSGDTWTGLSAITRGMPSGTAVLVVSKGVDTSGNLMAPATSLFTIDLLPPLAPVNTNVSYVSATGKLQISWQPAPGKSVISYNLYRSAAPMTSTVGLFPIMTALTAASATDLPGLDSPTVYYGVTAIDASRNESPLSANASFANPLQPVVTSPASGAKVYTTTVTIQGLAQPGALVDVLADVGGGVEVPLGTVPAAADRAFSVPVTLAKGANKLKVQARSALLPLVRSPAALLSVNVVIIPQGVTGLQAAEGDTVIDLTWTASQEASVTGYRIYRNGSQTPLNATLIPSNQNRFRDLALTNGRAYSYVITAVDDTGLESPASAPVQARPQAGPGWGGI